ncbi:GntR family transcriptional regulator [Portibacter lacus]|uniref:GntR family transcriptional regulator n=1 Tax=Portibacter lacus TaxID=1099794 RepID=A0AA37SP31_9BACT|nr:GntR family transcriptional regulator [Portibacter lacus]GLR16281.1 GntR family transcriptional regulator [Portibacter lacus]
MEFNSNNSIYIQIADRICEQILSDEIAGEDRIPSVREFAADIQVNPNTVMRTYGHLQDQGILYNKRGIGYFVSDNAKDIVMKTKKAEFIKESLPEFFKMMDLLKIDFKELEKIYKKSTNLQN